MIVNCDKCGAKFQLADEKVGPKGVKVRCSKCKSVFTVKKGDGQEAASAAPAPPPAAGGSGPAGDDPFSDFNFSDDMDFGEESDGEISPDESAPAPSAPSPPPPAPGMDPGFLEDSPAAPVSGGDDFDFADEDFSLSDGEEEAPAPPPKPAPPKPAPPKAASPKAASPKAGADDDFGDFKFDDDSFADSGKEAAPPGAPPPAPEPKPAASPPSDEEWGNVSFGEDEGFGAGAGAGDGDDDGGFGDFQFDADDSLPDRGGDDLDMPMDVDDFIRSPSSKKPAGDDLEASIGDADFDGESSRGRTEIEESSAAPPPPPKPVISRPAQKSSAGKYVGLVFLALLVAAGVAAGLNIEKIKQMPAVQKFMIEKGWIPEPETGEIMVEKGYKVDTVTREDGSVIVVVTGQVTNGTNKVKSNILVEVTLKDETEQRVVTGRSYCDVSFALDDLQTMSKDFILGAMDTSGGRNMGCIEVGPRESRAFTVVFFDYPAGKLKFTAPSVVGANNVGE